MLLRRNLIQVFTRNYARPAYNKYRNDPLTSILIDKPEVIQWESIRKKMLENEYSVSQSELKLLLKSILLI